VREKSTSQATGGPIVKKKSGSRLRMEIRQGKGNGEGATRDWGGKKAKCRVEQYRGVVSYRVDGASSAVGGRRADGRGGERSPIGLEEKLLSEGKCRMRHG